MVGGEHFPRRFAGKGDDDGAESAARGAPLGFAIRWRRFGCSHGRDPTMGMPSESFGFSGKK
jgi:hypothetical protein